MTSSGSVLSLLLTSLLLRHSWLRMGRVARGRGWDLGGGVGGRGWGLGGGIGGRVLGGGVRGY